MQCIYEALQQFLVRQIDIQLLLNQSCNLVSIDLTLKRRALEKGEYGGKPQSQLYYYK